MNDAEHYYAIRASINSNLMTIKSLLEQANGLHEVVAGLAKTVDSGEKKKLDDSLSNIYKSIDMLVIQTDNLFKAFVEYANSREGAGV